jgi:hypothetical protein
VILCQPKILISITDFNEKGKSLDDYLEEMQKEFSK